LLLAAGLAWSARYLIQKSNSGSWAEHLPGWSSWWPVAAVVTGLGGLAAVILLAAQNGGWHSGNSTANLITILHYRFPLALLVAIAVLALGAAAAWLAATVSQDETRHHETLEEKRQREERMARRRADREAARQARRQGRAT
jgi:hypothetical protein